MSPGESFVALFESMTMLTACLWVTGLILFAVEYFQPMRGLAYILGVLLLAAAFVSRVVYSTVGEAFFFLFITAIVLFATHAVSMYTQKRDWLRVARLKKVGERNRKYQTLVNSVGVANTPIDLTGNVVINDVNLVVSSEKPIPAGDKVRIVRFTPDKIIVENIDDK